MTDTTHARNNAIAWFTSVTEMVDAYRKTREADDDSPDAVTAIEDAQEHIRESVLSVEVRGDWHAYGDTNDKPAEYRILLTTGGPALMLTGELDEYGEPSTARLEFQDWGTPWIELRDSAEMLLTAGFTQDGTGWLDRAGSAHEFPHEIVDAYLLDFARQFYFGA